MARYCLLDEVSVQEMLDMRNIEGLSNGEIAERLDVHPTTVHKYIGAGHIRRAYRTKKEETVADPSFAGLLLSARVERYIGSRHRQMVLTNGKILDILQMHEDGENPILTGLNKNDVETLVEELKSILSLMKE